MNEANEILVDCKYSKMDVRGWIERECREFCDLMDDEDWPRWGSCKYSIAMIPSYSARVYTKDEDGGRTNMFVFHEDGLISI